MKSKFTLCISILLIISLNKFYAQPKAPAAYVNPLIGTTNGGNTFPGAVVPWGMVSVSPYTGGGDPGGYKYGQEFIYGFGHIHMSGVGCADMGNVILMPATGEFSSDPEKYKSRYANETVAAGYYKTELSNYKITAEMTSTERSGISRYTLNADTTSMNLLIDVSKCLNSVKGGLIRILSPTELDGYSYFGGFCGDEFRRKVYFYIKLNKTAQLLKLWENGKLQDSLKLESENLPLGAFLNFKMKKDESIMARVGISYVSSANAKLNLETEQPAWNFEKVKKNAFEKWNRELSRIKIEGGTEDQKACFYTGLYHMLIHPNIFNDVNGEYRALETEQIKKAVGYTRYTIYSLWDTYRNLHPFLTLVYPERELDIVKSMVGMYNDYGWLPKWEMASRETFMMVGYPALPVIADTYLKGIKAFDVNTAYEAMKKMATAPANKLVPLRPGIGQLMKYGYIPQDDTTDEIWGPVSTSLEYNFADWTLSQMAKSLKKEDDYNYFYNRSLFYKNYFDTTTQFLRPRMKDGSWLIPFDPVTMEGAGSWAGAGGPGYVEGNAWQYMFFAHHDVDGLISLYGGKDHFLKKLRELFEGNHFVLWNEPDMGFPFLFNFLKGEEWRTQQKVNELMGTYFKNTPGGLPGNDDTGVTSAWFVFSSMGFYPFCPGDTKYELTSPVFNRITIKLNNKFYPGKEIVIEKKNGTGKNDLIKQILLNNKILDSFSIDHFQLTKGAKITFQVKQ